jgi:hypothetical protein
LSFYVGCLPMLLPFPFPPFFISPNARYFNLYLHLSVMPSRQGSCNSRCLSTWTHHQNLPGWPWQSVWSIRVVHAGVVAPGHAHKCGYEVPSWKLSQYLYQSQVTCSHGNTSYNHAVCCCFRHEQEHFF